MNGAAKSYVCLFCGRGTVTRLTTGEARSSCDGKNVDEERQALICERLKWKYYFRYSCFCSYYEILISQSEIFFIPTYESLDIMITIIHWNHWTNQAEIVSLESAVVHISKKNCRREFKCSLFTISILYIIITFTLLDKQRK